MTNRILDLSESPARLRVRNRQLVIQRDDGAEVSFPLADLAVLVVSHPQVSYTHAVISGLVAQGGAFVACDQRHLPTGMLLPLVGHSTQVERFAAQAQASLPTRKRLWQQLVRAKIEAQAQLLRQLRNSDHGISALGSRVKSGDPSNVEAQASRRYWRALFADAQFHRRRDLPDQNRLLNYGYAVLRAIVARAVCAAGLHPSLGLHHHNRYDAYCLVDDLMEPFRPLVDRAVALYVREHGIPEELDKEARQHLLRAVTGRVAMGDEQRTVFDAASRTASSLVKVFLGEAKQLDLPALWTDAQQ